MQKLTAVRVGNTQSNMSIPRATHTTKSVANPTPIRYLGLFLSSISVPKLTIGQKSSFASPPLKMILQILLD